MDIWHFLSQKVLEAYIIRNIMKILLYMGQSLSNSKASLFTVINGHPYSGTELFWSIIDTWMLSQAMIKYMLLWKIYYHDQGGTWVVHGYKSF